MQSRNTIFDRETREKLITRIAQLDENNRAVWGKMNLLQMLKHNTYWNEWMLGTARTYTYKQELLGKLFGKYALRKMIKDDRPFDKNIPTSKQFKVSETHGEITAEKAKWTSLIQAYENYHNPDFVHDFFGKMTAEQIGILVYKHCDHHLRQFRG